MLIVIVWWLWMQVIGLAALPLTWHFFRHLPDRGYSFTRPLGLLLTSYVLWLGSSLGLLRNSVGGAIFSLVVVATTSLILYWRGRATAQTLRAAAQTQADAHGRRTAAGSRGLGGWKPGLPISEVAAEVSSDAEPGLLAWVRANARLVVTVELLFAAAFALWALIRAYSPDLTTAGGEKFMEIMYLNSIGRSETFPPHDAWLSGYAISYYYFGYVMIAMLTRLSGFASNLTFNVGVALLFALTCTGAFGLVYNLVKRFKASEDSRTASSPVLWGFLGTILVAVLGNLEGFLEVLYSLRLLPVSFWQWLDIQDINQPFSAGAGASVMPTRSGWWWWRASRVIHDLDPAGNSMGIQPIDEFPGFSFLLGDMHPHVLALPFVLLALALALNVLFDAQKGTERAAGGQRWWEPARRLSPLVPLCLGGLAFLNTWDFPIYLLIFVLAYGLGHFAGPGPFGEPMGAGGKAAEIRPYGQFDWPFVRDVGLTAVTATLLGFLFYLPFYIGFQSQAGGLLPTLYVGTRFRQYFVMFGPFLVAIAGLLATAAALDIKARQGDAAKAELRSGLLRGWAGWTAAFILAPLMLMFLIILIMLLLPQGREFLEGIRRVPFVYDIVGDAPWLSVLSRLLVVKLRTWLMPLIVAMMAALGATLLQRSLTSCSPSTNQGRREILSHPSIQFALICAVVGLLLTLSVEFVYLSDVFQVRMNTIFKFYFQAWVLMAIAGSFAIYWLSHRRGRAATAVVAAFWLLAAMGMVYPILGNATRAGSFRDAPSLDGTAYLAASEPEDYAAIDWLNENVQGAPLILETPGSDGASYQYKGRVSALTGLPTLLGWAGHENQWRGSYEVQEAREPDIDAIYNTLDSQVALELLEHYGITYVYVGPLERQTYDPRALEKFERFLDPVYQQGGVTIYKLAN